MVSARWRPFELSIFSKMSQLALAHQAVNLAQGFPDFDGPSMIKDAAIAAIKGPFNQYAPSAGLPALRQALAARQAQAGVNYDPIDEVTVFSGATEAIFCTITGLCEPGDEVLAFEPFYDSYPVATMMAGATFRTVPLRAPNWTFDLEALRQAITPKTKLLLLNSPHNPTGKVFKWDELKQIADLAKQHNFYVMTDEVYEELVYLPARHISLAVVPGMRERCIVVSSTSKTFSMTGWKIGYAFAPREITQTIRIPHQYTVFCSATPLQQGMVSALELGNDYFQLFRDEYEARRLRLFQLLREQGFVCQMPEGTYFIVADYSRLLDINDVEFANWLTKEVGVACIPLSVFYQNSAEGQKSRYVRFGFCKDLKTIEAAAEKFDRRLKPALKVHPQFKIITENLT